MASPVCPWWVGKTRDQLIEEVERLRRELKECGEAYKLEMKQGKIQSDRQRERIEELEDKKEGGYGSKWNEESLRARIAELEEEKDAALAVLRLPGLDNNGGPGDLVEEVKLWNENLNRYMRDGHLITRDQIRAAWARKTDFSDQGLILLPADAFGILRCEGCGGEGVGDIETSESTGPLGTFEFVCEDCHGHGWIIRPDYNKTSVSMMIEEVE